MPTEIFLTEGKVTAVSQKGGHKYGLCLDGTNWYNGYGAPKAYKGDTVKIEFEKDGIWNVIKQVTVLEKAKVPELTPASEYKPMTGDKALTMLVSYAKDLVVSKIYQGATNPIDEMFDAANNEVWRSYNFFKNKLNNENENKN